MFGNIVSFLRPVCPRRGKCAPHLAGGVAFCIALAVGLSYAPHASAQAILPLPRPDLQRQVRALHARRQPVPFSTMRNLLAPPKVVRAAPRPITQLLVKLKPGVDFHTFADQFSASSRANPSLTNALAAAAGKPLLQYVRSHEGIGWTTYRVPSPELLTSVLDALRKDGRVAHAEPDYRIMRFLAPPNNYYWGQLDWENTYAVWGLGDEDETDAYSDDSTTWTFTWSEEQISSLQAWSVYPGHYQTASERMGLLQSNPARLPIVGDIDTGVDMTQPDFSYTGNPSGGIADTDVRNGGQLNIQYSRAFTGPDFDGYQGDDPTLAMDDYGHGTATAGLIAAAPNNGGIDAAFVKAHPDLTWTAAGVQVYASGTLGVGFPAQVVALKVIDAEGDGSDSDVIDAMMYACADWKDPNTGITHTSPHCMILNMSLALDTTNYPQALQDAVDFAWSHGTLIVAAAGNDGAGAGGPGSNTPRYPARCDKVLAISATTYNYPDGGVPVQITSYSNYGDQVGVCAPGGDAQEYENSASGDFVIDPIPELIMPFTLQPSYYAVLNDPNGESEDSEYAALGFANLYVGEFPGTSFSAPQVTGLAALYASKHQYTQSTANGPQLIVNAIERGADSINGLSGGAYDEVYGWGEIDAAGTIQDVNVRNATLGGCIGRIRYIDTVVGDVTVSAQATTGGTTYTATTDPDGLYHLENLPTSASGTTYNVSATVYGNTATTQVKLVQGCDQLGINLTVGSAATVALKSMTVNPTVVVGSQNTTGTVTLTGTATSNTTVTLSSSTTAAGVPSSVTVLSGASSQTFTITTKAVTTKTVAVISTTLGTVTKKTTLTIKPIGVKSVTLSPNTVVGSLTSLGTVTLQAPATSKITVTLSSSDPSVAKPVTSAGKPLSSVTIAAGSVAASFTVATYAVTSTTPVTIGAAANSVSQSAKLTVTPIGLLTFRLSPTSVKGGNSVTGTLTLTHPAAPGAITVTFASNSTAVPAPAPITIPAGSTSGTVTITTNTVTANTTAIITATANGTTKNGVLKVIAP